MKINKNSVPVRMQVPGVTMRLLPDFGNMDGYGKVSGEYFSLAAGVDSEPLFMGLEGNLCQCPHWGFVLKGRITTTDAEGRRETVEAEDLFYWPPGHNVRVEADADIIMFSPAQEHICVIDHLIEVTSAAPKG